MARQYSHRQFFRRVPNTLLGRYFHDKCHILKEFSFDELKETEVESIFKAFTALPDEKQAEIEAELSKPIFDFAFTLNCVWRFSASSTEGEFAHDEKNYLSCIRTFLPSVPLDPI